MPVQKLCVNSRRGFREPVTLSLVPDRRLGWRQFQVELSQHGRSVRGVSLFGNSVFKAFPFGESSFMLIRPEHSRPSGGSQVLSTLIPNCTFLNCRNLNSSRQVRGSTSSSPQARFVLNYAQLQELPSSGGSPTLNEWDDCLEAGYRPPNPKLATG